MSLDTVLEKIKIYQDGREAYPAISDMTYENSQVTGWNKVSITASASDETVAISDIGTVKRLVLKVLPADVNKITVSINGSGDTFKVNPRLSFSENVTAVTASNSSTSAVNLYWRAIYG